MLNKQGPGKIDWTDYTWNPIAGCKHGCPYCYMRRMERRFPGIMVPVYRPNYLLDPVKKRKPAKIFVGSSGDMWGDWVSDHWIDKVLDVVELCVRHTFQFLTKNPERYGWFHLPSKNAWYGTTVDGTKRTENNISTLHENTPACSHLRFISFEPLLARVAPDLLGMSWVIIGADSTHGAKRPPREWADIIIDEARRHNIPVFVKDNYGYPERIKEFPSS